MTPIIIPNQIPIIEDSIIKPINKSFGMPIDIKNIKQNKIISIIIVINVRGVRIILQNQ